MKAVKYLEHIVMNCKGLENEGSQRKASLHRPVFLHHYSTKKTCFLGQH